MSRAAVLAAAGVVFLLDALTAWGVAGVILYLPVIWLAFRSQRSFDVYATALVCTVLAMIDIGISPTGGDIVIVMMNRGLGISAIWMTAALCAQVLRSRRTLAGRDRYRGMIVDHALDAVITMDPQGRVVDWNPEAERTFGWTRDEALGNELSNLIIPVEYREAHRGGLARYRATGEAKMLNQRLELTAVRKDGGTFPVEISVVAIPLDRQVLFNAFVRDITHRQEDAEYRARLAALVDSSYDAIIGTDVSGLITSWNLGAERVYGFSEQEALGQSIKLILPPGLEDQEPEILRAIEHQQRLEQFETRRRRKDGRLIPVSLTVSPIADDDGRIIGSSTIERDITDLKQNEEELRQAKEAAEQAARVRAEFLANISHELQTPMNAIIGMTQLALEENLSGDVRDYVATANKSAHVLLSLLNDILDFSKLESGKFTIEHQPFRLRELVADAVQSLTPSAQEKGLELISELEVTELEELWGDRERLRQVLTNLISNAVKFTEQGQVVVTVRTVRLWPHEARIRFGVRDTGVGIAEAELKRILEPFTQIDASFTRRHGGTGLGLAICNELLRLMGGRLAIESQPGQGSCFSFELSLARASAPTDAPETPGATTSHGLPSVVIAEEADAKLSVLLAEDTPANQKVVTGILRKRGHHVVVAPNGQDVVRLFRSQPFDVVLMDVQMPLMDGYQATAAIRGLQAGQAEPTPIIAMTAHGLRGDRERCLAAGMDAYISKPIDVVELIDMVESVAQGRRAEPRAPLPPTPPEQRLLEPAPSAAEDEVIDLDGAMRRLAGDMELFRDFIGYFEEDAPKLLAALHEALANSAAAEVRRAAHSLKGLAANFGASACATAAQAIEECGKSGDLPTASQILPRLEQEVAKLDRVLGPFRQIR